MFGLGGTLDSAHGNADAGTMGYKNGKLSFNSAKGAAEGQPGNGGVRYIDDALSPTILHDTSDAHVASDFFLV